MHNDTFHNKESGKKRIQEVVRLSLSDYLNAQIDTFPPAPTLPDYRTENFEELISSYNLTNFRSGLICTAQRQDTIFAIFYLSRINDLKCVPIGILYSDRYFTFEDSDRQPIFRKLRSTNGILSSKIISNFSLKKEQIFVIQQTLAQHIRLKKSEDWFSKIYQRIFYYNSNHGIYKVEYLEKPNIQDTYFNWPYLEGDFIF